MGERDGSNHEEHLVHAPLWKRFGRHLGLNAVHLWVHNHARRLHSLHPNVPHRWWFSV